ncbi:MAG: hypothetical protein KAI66_00405 [Lentisphaeria bacterium]|nr:hypothetical protein [Lentisphaeria bacterium]
MPAPKCPGQDMRYWTAEDIFDVACPFCGDEIEFWKDEPIRLCSGCGVEVRNPRIDLGCAKWCKFAEECLGKNVDHLTAAAPIIETLRASLAKALKDEPKRLAFAEEVHRLADTLAVPEREADPRVLKCAALLLGADVAPFPKHADLPQDLPEQAGLDAETSSSVRQTMDEAQSSPCPEGAEIRIVHDALVLAQAQHAAPPPNPETLADSLVLHSARLLARHRFQSD